MAKIRSLGNKELKQVLSLLERFSGDEFNYPVLEHFQTLYMPLRLINQLLPLKFRFLPAIYVATDSDKVLGLVWLSRDGYRQDRWKVEQIIINPEYASAYDVGKQLMEYVINKYGAMGVETFLAYVDPHYTEGLGLLKECGFRHCTKVHTYQLEKISEELKERKIYIRGLREARSTDAQTLKELYTETLMPEVRISLQKSAADLTPPLMDMVARRIKGEFFKRWVISTESQEHFYGSIAISTWDYRQFDISILISPAWESETEDLIVFAVQQVAKCTSHPKILVHSYDFHKTKKEVLTQLGFERVWTTEVLVKDYWTPVKDKALQSKNPVLLFAKGGKTSPA